MNHVRMEVCGGGREGVGGRKRRGRGEKRKSEGGEGNREKLLLEKDKHYGRAQPHLLDTC